MTTFGWSEGVGGGGGAGGGGGGGGGGGTQGDLVHCRGLADLMGLQMHSLEFPTILSLTLLFSFA